MGQIEKDTPALEIKTIKFASELSWPLVYLWLGMCSQRFCNQHSMIKRIAELNWEKKKRHKMQTQIALGQIWSKIETVKKSHKKSEIFSLTCT